MLRPVLGALGVALPVALASLPARAATWGSFSPSRMAYATGSLGGEVHDALRGHIEAHGDELAAPTDALTDEYLAGVDVFYTGMLSDGTGPTAGGLGTLSLAEQAALQGFVAGGGTVIVAPDSNGFEGPFAIVYDSWLQDVGVGDLVFVFGFGEGTPVIAHPVTEGVTSVELDGAMTFAYPAEAQPLAILASSSEPWLAVLEPATGFDAGGRVLVLGDHNALTDGYIGMGDNDQLAQNVVAWAAGECGNTILEASEECDDGNLDPGDGCDAACALEGSAEGTSGGDDTAGGSTGGSTDAGTSAETTAAGDDTGPMPGSTGPGGSTSATPGGSDGSEDGTSDAPADEAGDGGCGCRGAGRRAGGLAGLLVLLGARRRRASRRRHRAGPQVRPGRARSLR